MGKHRGKKLQKRREKKSAEKSITDEKKKRFALQQFSVAVLLKSGNFISNI